MEKMMTSPKFLEQFSQALAARTQAARAYTAEINSGDRHAGNGILWRPDIVITSEQSLGRGDSFEVKLAGGGPARATLASRDRGTNVAVLKLETVLSATPLEAAEPVAGSLALAFGADGHGGIAVHLGLVSAVSPEWRSRAGGRIERRIALDIAHGESHDGGPVVDASGALIGMSTLGHRAGVLVIPPSTIAHSVEMLLQHGRVERGWLGAALQPVAVPDEMRAATGQESALMVMGTDKDGPAATAGIMTGDVLLQIDSAPLTHMHALSDRLGPESVGKQLELKLIRAGAIVSVRATIAVRPAADDESRHDAWRGAAEHWKQMASHWRHHHHHRGSHRHGC
jgi:S1-C subfamily serine protease